MVSVATRVIVTNHPGEAAVLPRETDAACTAQARKVTSHGQDIFVAMKTDRDKEH